MADTIYKILDKTTKSIPILRRLGFVFLSVYFTRSCFNIDDLVAHIQAYLDVALISSVAKVCLGTAAFVVVCGAAAFMGVGLIGAAAKCLGEKNDRTDWGRRWQTLELGAELLDIHIGPPIEFAVYVVFLSSSLLLALGEDCVVALCALVPGGFPWQATIFLVNFIAWLTLEICRFLNLFHKEEDTRPPLGA